MSDNKKWKWYDCTDPKKLGKCRRRQKLNYEKIVTCCCFACERNFNDLQYINTLNLNNIN